jgi:hypothetical protein
MSQAAPASTSCFPAPAQYWSLKVAAVAYGILCGESCAGWLPCPVLAAVSTSSTNYWLALEADACICRCISSACQLISRPATPREKQAGSLGLQLTAGSDEARYRFCTLLQLCCQICCQIELIVTTTAHKAVCTCRLQSHAARQAERRAAQRDLQAPALSSLVPPGASWNTRTR